MEWLRARLVDKWRNLVRLASVRLHLAAVAIAALYAAMPVLDPAIAAALPAPLQTKAIGAYAAIGLIVRVLRFRRSNAA
jgi:hypothetical protein